MGLDMEISLHDSKASLTVTEPDPEASVCHTPSSFSIEGESQDAALARARGGSTRCRKVVLPASIFFAYTICRAAHPLTIEASMVEKTVVIHDIPTPQRTYEHEAISVPLVECVVTFAISSVLCLWNGGTREWLTLWQPSSLKVFGLIGLIYSLGDLLELLCLGSLSGVMYQVLGQSKLLMTAIMIWGIKGQKQSFLQWTLLVLVMLSLVCFTVMKDLLAKHQQTIEAGSGGDSGKAAPSAVGGEMAFGVCMGLLQVGVISFCDVLADKYIKSFKRVPIYVQLGQFKVLWFFSLLGLTYFNGGEQLYSHGLFHDWSPEVVASLISFTLKDWIGMALLLVLDAMHKNFSEASAVLVAYFLAGLHPGSPDEHDFEAVMILLVVVLSIAAYLASMNIVAKAEKHDLAERCREKLQG